LRSLNLLGEVDAENSCPICGQPVAHQTTHTADLRARMEALERDLASARALEPSRRDEVNVLMHEGRRLRIRLDEIDVALNELTIGLRGELDRTAAEQRAYVVGRITEFLNWEKAREPGRESALKARRQRIEGELDLLDQITDRATVDAAVESRLTFVDADMSAWAHELGLERSEDPIKFDLGNLTVYAATKVGPVPLRQIGSASNWVGYHLVAHLAMHKWFAEQARPVPNFLVLDQPEQAYFPADVRLDPLDPLSSLKDQDLQRVENLYEFIHDRVEAMQGKLQVLVLGHWNPSSIPWFADARVDNFRHGRALVPHDWLPPMSG
jgi:hypothetical protein